MLESDLDKSRIQIWVCDVHRLVNKDTEHREVAYCGLCDAWICKECSPDFPKRAYAMILKKLKNEKK